MRVGVVVEAPCSDWQILLHGLTCPKTDVFVFLLQTHRTSVIDLLDCSVHLFTFLALQEELHSIPKFHVLFPSVFSPDMTAFNVNNLIICDGMPSLVVVLKFITHCKQELLQ